MTLDTFADLLLFILVGTGVGFILFRLLRGVFPIRKYFRWRPLPWREVASHYAWALKALTSNRWFLFIPLVILLIGSSQTIYWQHNIMQKNFTPGATFHDIESEVQFVAPAELLRNTTARFLFTLRTVEPFWHGVFTEYTAFLLILYYILFWFNGTGFKRALCQKPATRIWVLLLHLAGTLFSISTIILLGILFIRPSLFDNYLSTFALILWGQYVPLAASLPVVATFYLILFKFFRSFQKDEKITIVPHQYGNRFMDIFLWLLFVELLYRLHAESYRVFGNFTSIEGPWGRLFERWIAMLHLIEPYCLVLLSFLVLFVPITIVLQTPGLWEGIKKGITFATGHAAGTIQLIAVAAIPLLIIDALSSFISFFLHYPFARVEWLLSICNSVLLSSLRLCCLLLVSLALFSFWWTHREESHLLKPVQDAIILG